MTRRTSIQLADITYPSFAEAERKFGIPAGVAKARVRAYGWTHEEAFGLCERKHARHRSICVAGVEYANEGEAARAHGLRASTVRKRLRRGLSVEQAFELEGSGYQPTTKKLTVRGVAYPSNAAAAKAHGVKYPVFFNRVHNLGWSIEQALELVAPPNGHQKVLGRIYVVTHIETAKRYVGLTASSLPKRWAEHVKKARSGAKLHPDSLQAAILQYGEKAFNIAEVAVCHTKGELAKLERKYIEEFRTTAPNGFNLALGGAGVHSHSKGTAITIAGIRYETFAQACRVLNKSEHRMRRLLRDGRTPDEAFSLPGGRKLCYPVTFRGYTYPSETKLAAAFRVNRATYQARRSRGYTVEQCLGLVPRLDSRTTVVRKEKLRGLQALYLDVTDLKAA